jgi:hypothetical protein
VHALAGEQKDQWLNISAWPCKRNKTINKNIAK